jgi:hypothetical protein
MDRNYARHSQLDRQLELLRLLDDIFWLVSLA